MIKYLFAFAIMLFASTFVIAEEDENVGKIDSVNPEYLHVVIDDSLYTFALNTYLYFKSVTKYYFSNRLFCFDDNS